MRRKKSNETQLKTWPKEKYNKTGKPVRLPNGELQPREPDRIKKY